jgi:toxin ParE1/3/4
VIATKPVGRAGRVTGTWAKSVTGLAYIVADTVIGERGAETLVILRVIHTARRWDNESWPD